MLAFDCYIADKLVFCQMQVVRPSSSLADRQQPFI